MGNNHELSFQNLLISKYVNMHLDGIWKALGEKFLVMHQFFRIGVCSCSLLILINQF